MDRARADYDDDAVVLAMQDAVDRLARLEHGQGCLLVARILSQQVRRWRKLLDLLDPQIIGHVAHCSGLSVHLLSLSIRKQKKTARSAWRFGSIRCVLRAPFDLFRQWPEKAVKVEEEAVRKNVHARKIPEL